MNKPKVQNVYQIHKRFASNEMRFAEAHNCKKIIMIIIIIFCCAMFHFVIVFICYFDSIRSR